MAHNYCSSSAVGSQPASTECICSAQLLTRRALLSALGKNQLALRLSTGNCLVWGKSNATGFQVATAVLKMLQLLHYLWGNKLAIQALLLSSLLPPYWRGVFWGKQHPKT